MITLNTLSAYGFYRLWTVAHDNGTDIGQLDWWFIMELTDEARDRSLAGFDKYMFPPRVISFKGGNLLDLDVKVLGTYIMYCIDSGCTEVKSLLADLVAVGFPVVEVAEALEYAEGMLVDLAAADLFNGAPDDDWACDSVLADSADPFWEEGWIEDKVDSLDWLSPTGLKQLLGVVEQSGGDPRVALDLLMEQGIEEDDAYSAYVIYTK